MVVERLRAQLTKVKARWWYALAGVVVAVGIGTAGYAALYVQPKVVSPIDPALGTRTVSPEAPVVITFDQPLDIGTLTYGIHPDLAGTWAVDSRAFGRTATLTFTPTESPAFDTRYTIELHGIKSLLGNRREDFLLSFQTDTPPKIESVSPVEGAADVMPDAAIVVVLDKPLTATAALTVTTVPEVTFEPPQVTDRTATFTHAAPLQKSTDYTVTVTLATATINYLTKVTTIGDEPLATATTTFRTVAAPGVDTYAPKGTGIEAESVIRIGFKQAMDRTTTQAAFSLEPPAPGTFSWGDDRTVTFTPNAPLTKGQRYTVTLAATATAVSGFTLEEAFTFSFTTIGLTTVAGWTPARNATNVDLATTISVSFNQAVVPASAESRFTITPTVAGTFSWSGNTMTFHPTASLAYGTAYTATVGKGVTSVKGLDSTSEYSATFTTKYQTVMLSVPAYRQDHVYSCMISAARSALAFRGKSASEASIIARVGLDATPWSGTWGGDNGVWGDPDAAIVGPLDNGQATSPSGKKTTNVYWGYGSHWGPISSVLSSYGVTNEVRSGMTVAEVAQAIADGDPVIVWWVNGIWPSYRVNWKTPSGKAISGVNGLHVQVVRGFTGSVDNPISFTVTDSGFGYPGRTYDIGTFKAKWKWFNNTGIIVR